MPTLPLNLQPPLSSPTPSPVLPTCSRDDRDEERLEELRALNRATKEETGEYMSPEEIAAIRPPRWTGACVPCDREADEVGGVRGNGV